ncbi:MAG: ComEC/Rec2 family competence protein, partial [Clostridia bacterium]|nr:ComEC/Rec2 family competence protein [Clostridia bacterium]
LFTFVSTFAILTLASPLCSAVADRIDPYYHKMKKWRLYSAASYVLTGALISAAVFLFSLPMNLLIFGEVQLLAPIFSAILIPLFTPCLFIGVAFLLVLLLPFGVPFITEAVHFVIRLFLNVVRLLAAAAPEAVSFGEYNIPVALFLIALFGVFITFRCKLRTFLMLYVSLTAAMLPMVLFA